MIPALNQCDFCNELSGSSDNSFGRIYGTDQESRILFRSTSFAVIPSLGQILEGYLLVVPTKHFRAVGDLTNADLEELERICEMIGGILKNNYGPHILFEHGTRSEGEGGCGIYHAHLHATPVGRASDPITVLKRRFPHTELHHLREIADRSANLRSYLFYQDSSAHSYLFDTGPLPSQYVRKLLTDALGENSWNWRTVEKEERLLATLKRLSGQFGSIDQ